MSQPGCRGQIRSDVVCRLDCKYVRWQETFSKIYFVHIIGSWWSQNQIEPPFVFINKHNSRQAVQINVDVVLSEVKVSHRARVLHACGAQNVD